MLYFYGFAFVINKTLYWLPEGAILDANYIYKR